MQPSVEGPKGIIKDCQNDTTLRIRFNKEEIRV